MAILGIRCSNSDYAYTVVEGTKEQPIILEENLISYPAEYPKPKSLRWFYQEIEGLFSKHSIKRLVIKGAEAMATRDKAFVGRTEYEAVAILVAGTRGLIRVSRKVKVTIAKDLGIKGRAKYLDTKLDKSVVTGFEDRPPKIQEAILAAWSDLG